MVVATSDSPANSEILGLQITVNDTLNNMQKPSVSSAINKEVQPSVAINGTLDPLAKLITNPSVTDLGKYDQDAIIEQPISEKHPTQVPDGPLCGDIDAQKAQGKLIIHQLVWCDICKVNCSSKSNFERHIVGKKHQKKLKTSGKEELVSMAMGTSLRMNFKAISCALSAIPSIDNESVQMKLDHVHTYYEILNMPVEALHAFIAEHDRLFTAIEYCNLLKLQVPGREVPDDAKARMADILPI